MSHFNILIVWFCTCNTFCDHFEQFKRNTYAHIILGPFAKHSCTWTENAYIHLTSQIRRYRQFRTHTLHSSQVNVRLLAGEILITLNHSHGLPAVCHADDHIRSFHTLAERNNCKTVCGYRHSVKTLDRFTHSSGHCVGGIKII